MKKELPPKYDPHGLETKWYQLWEKEKLFSFKFKEDHQKREKFSMVIPPPNVTGSLHLGHALNHTIQDILARCHRMKGRSVLWLPGTDHAGIATQNVVEKLLAKEGASRQSLGREEFEKRVWQWKEESGSMITRQQRQLGESVDWDYECFTLDQHLNTIVNQVFIRLYKEGLIYRAERMINWCPLNQTALSNIEVEYKTIQGNLYYIKYPIEGEESFLLIATTRPETLLGDEALAVHPDDSRYSKFLGKSAILPLVNKKIPIISDNYVDRDFGSGVVKITPAHDPNDFEMGKRHDLPITVVIDGKGKINEQGGIYAGLSREEARKKIVSDLEKEGLLERVEKYKHQVGHSYRSGAVVEPMVSTQWFVDAKKLAGEAIRVVEEKKIRFIPQRWEKVYFEWMRNIQDWCISRQLWWGHRIPAWYDGEGNIYVGLSEEDARKKNGLPPDVSLRQEEDVLDTWFSSALWPFATFWKEDEVFASEDWPKPSGLHESFYPNSALVTGFDIIFFWVARMIMMGLHFQKDIPFREVYIHGLVRDAGRQKMSKSKGNVVNPLEKMEEYGTDAFRFFLISILPEGKDIIYDESRLKGYQAFCNKIWNTARYLWMNQPPDYQIDKSRLSEISFSEADHWMIQHFNQALEKIEASIKNYRFSEYAQHIYDLTWKFYCDYYIELAKISLKDPGLEKATRYVLNLIFQNILKLLHPIMPFITEELYSYWDRGGAPNNGALSHEGEKVKTSDLILVSDWPEKIETRDSQGFEDIENIIHVIYSIRNLRGELSIPPGEKLEASILIENTADHKNIPDTLAKYREHIMTLARLGDFKFLETASEAKGVKAVLRFGSLFLDVSEKIDMKKEKERLNKERQKIEKELTSLGSRMNNQDFLKKAPPDIIEKEKTREVFLRKKSEEVEELLNSFFIR